jgi:hypothetical protein
VGERSRFLVGILKISVHIGNDEFVKSSMEKRVLGKGVGLGAHFGDSESTEAKPKYHVSY